ncbi:hypothetical protein RFI_07534, partial [Reticulomyxa filosa]
DSNDQSHENRAKSPKQSKVKLFDNIKCVESMRCKQVYLFHGVNDDIIPLQHSEALENKILQVQQQSANEKEGEYFQVVKLFRLNNRGHNDIDITQDVAVKLHRAIVADKTKASDGNKSDSQQDRSRQSDNVLKLKDCVNKLCDSEQRIVYDVKHLINNWYYYTNFILCLSFSKCYLSEREKKPTKSSYKLPKEKKSRKEYLEKRKRKKNTQKKIN